MVNTISSAGKISPAGRIQKEVITERVARSSGTNIEQQIGLRPIDQQQQQVSQPTIVPPTEEEIEAQRQARILAERERAVTTLKTERQQVTERLLDLEANNPDSPDINFLAGRQRALNFTISQVEQGKISLREAQRFVSAAQPAGSGIGQSDIQVSTLQEKITSGEITESEFEQRHHALTGTLPLLVRKETIDPQVITASSVRASSIAPTGDVAPTRQSLDAPPLVIGLPPTIPERISGFFGGLKASIPQTDTREVLLGFAGAPEDIRTGADIFTKRFIPEFNLTIQKEKQIELNQPIIRKETLQFKPTGEAIGFEKSIVTLPKTEITRSTISKGLGLTGELGLYATPFTAIPLGAGTVLRGTEKLKTPIPEFKPIKAGSRPTGVSSEAWKKYVKEVKEYNVAEEERIKQLKSFKKSGIVDIAFGITVLGTEALLIGSKAVPALAKLETKAGIEGGIGQRISSIGSKRSVKLTGLTPLEIKEFSSVKPGTARYFELRLKALRTLEKADDVIGVKAFGNIFPSLPAAGTGAAGVAAESALVAKRAKDIGGLSLAPEITLGKESLTKTQISKLVDDAVATKAFATKKEARRAIEEASIRSQTLKITPSKVIDVPKQPFALTESGLPFLETKRIRLPEIKSLGKLGQGEFKSFGLSTSRKTPKLGTIETQFSFGIGGRGQLKDLRLGVRRTPPKSKFTIIDIFEGGRKSTRKITTPSGLTFKQEFFDPIIQTEQFIVRVPKVRGKKFPGGLVIREFNPEFVTTFKKRKRGGPIDVFGKLDTTTTITEKELAKRFKEGAIFERQTVREFIQPDGKSFFQFQTGLKRTTDLTDQTIFLADAIGVEKRFRKASITSGFGEPAVKVKQLAFPEATPRRGGPIKGIVGGITDVTSPSKGGRQLTATQLKTLQEETALTITPAIKPKIRAAPRARVQPAFPKIVGGVGGPTAESTFSTTQSALSVGLLGRTLPKADIFDITSQGTKPELKIEQKRKIIPIQKKRTLTLIKTDQKALQQVKQAQQLKQTTKTVLALRTTAGSPTISIVSPPRTPTRRIIDTPGIGIPFIFALPKGKLRRTTRRTTERLLKVPRRKPSLVALGQGIFAKTRARGEFSGINIRPIIGKPKKKKKKKGKRNPMGFIIGVKK